MITIFNAIKDLKKFVALTDKIFKFAAICGKAQEFVNNSIVLSHYYYIVSYKTQYICHHN